MRGQKHRTPFWQLGTFDLWHLYRPLPRREPKACGGGRYAQACDEWTLALENPGRSARATPPTDRACSLCLRQSS